MKNISQDHRIEHRQQFYLKLIATKYVTDISELCIVYCVSDEIKTYRFQSSYCIIQK